MTTEAATEVGTSSALLRGTVNPHGLSTTYKFEYGAAKGSLTKSTTSGSAGSGSLPIGVSSSVSGLEPNTTYYFRISASNTLGTVVGGESSFTTSTVATTWSIQSTPEPSGAKSGALLFGSCTASNACTSVGRYVNSSGVRVPLAERWNGSTWASQSPPSPSGAGSAELLGVSCTSATLCEAAGFSATGGTRSSLAEVWNGSVWTIQSTPAPTGATLTELSAISCTSSTACTAVGSYRAGSGSLTLALRWNGSSWAVQSTPNPSGATESTLLGVSCASSTSCTAIGHYYASSGARYTLAEVWNGSTWAVQSSPNRAGSSNNVLLGISCSATTACTAVGGDYPSSGPQETLIERWNGTEWTIQTSANPSGSAASILHGVSCTSATSCTAVGDYVSGTVNNTLAERWNGSSWSLMSTPNPSGFTFAALWSVACTSTTTCVAPGYYEDSAGTEHPLTEASP